MTVIWASKEDQELDRQVVEKVLGLTWAVDESQSPGLNHGRCRDADGSVLYLSTATNCNTALKYVVPAIGLPWIAWSDASGITFRFHKPDYASFWEATADTLARAICRAALMCKGANS